MLGHTCVHAKFQLCRLTHSRVRRFFILNRDLRHELLSFFTFVVVNDDLMCLLQSHFLVYIVIQRKKE